MLESERFKKMQKNRKCFAYIGIFIVFQIIVMTVFGLTVMKIKTPSVRLRSVTVSDLSSSSSSFTATLIAEVAVKNKNFGSYRFDATTANVTYGAVTLGRGDIAKARAGLKKTKRFNVTIDVSSSGVSDSSTLATDLTAGNVTLWALSRVTGKVSLMGLMKKRKTANMNCSMIVNVPNKVVYDWTCK
ncbi:late embryogenesis abundant protein At1g64065-like [Argentina anserina]|uniref:late embryogenesis abundant protein At1g64065-like n=1 Tax=Argentina anserina TaxID=57926 RepID=UPI00217642AD|nr:late embryogenesis abundant protein At1g64065-like [Potentilla anserina]